MSAKLSPNKMLLEYWQDVAPADRMAHLVRDTARAYMRALQTRLQKHDVSFSYWQMLRVLWLRDGLTQRELSERAGVMEPTTQVVLRDMEKQGYVRRLHMSGNRKNKYVYLTDRGRALQQRLTPLAEDTNRVSQQGISEKDIKITREVLMRLLSNLAQDDGAASGV